MGKGAEHPSRSALHPPAKWYREPWPWLLMSGPAIVVVAACFTLWLAVTSNDGLVADDYYKRGLAINRMLERDRAAAARRFEAQVMLAPATGRVRVVLTGTALPASVTLKLVHPTRAGLDRSVRLDGTGGVYEGELDVPAAGRWGVALEDEHRTWRLTGDWQLPAQEPLRLAPHPEGVADGRGG